MIYIILLISLTIASLGAVKIQVPQGIDSPNDSDNRALPYQFTIPDSYDASISYPLVLWLQPSANGPLFSQPVGHVPASYREQSIVVSPHFAPDIRSYGLEAADDILAVVGAIREDYNIDPNRIYIQGYSRGGFGTSDIIDRGPPGLFAAGLPIAGASLHQYNKMGTAKWYFTGRSDPNNSFINGEFEGLAGINQSSRSRETGSTYGRVTSFRFNGHGGSIDSTSRQSVVQKSTTEEVYRWMFSQVSNTPFNYELGFKRGKDARYLQGAFVHGYYEKDDVISIEAPAPDRSQNEIFTGWTAEPGSAYSGDSLPNNLDIDDPFDTEILPELPESVTPFVTTAAYVHSLGVFADASSPITTFEMPDNDIVITANYEKLPMEQIVQWDFEADLEPTILDSSPSQNNAQNNGSTVVTGQTGNGRLFDGLNDFIQSDDLNLDYAFSFSCWARFSSLGQTAQAILGKENQAYALTVNQDGLSFSKNAVVELSHSVSLVPNRWYHITLTADYINGSKLYLDGAEVASANSLGSIPDNASPVLIGANGNSQFLNGVLDTIQIHSFALSPSQVTAIREGNTGPTLTLSGNLAIPFDNGASALLVCDSQDDGLPSFSTGITYQWTALNDEHAVTFANAQSSATLTSFSDPGIYQIQCVVSDGAVSSRKTMTVDVFDRALRSGGEIFIRAEDGYLDGPLENHRNWNTLSSGAYEVDVANQSILVQDVENVRAIYNRSLPSSSNEYIAQFDYLYNHRRTIPEPTISNGPPPNILVNTIGLTSVQNGSRRIELRLQRGGRGYSHRLILFNRSGPDNETETGPFIEDYNLDTDLDGKSDRLFLRLTIKRVSTPNQWIATGELFNKTTRKLVNSISATFTSDSNYYQSNLSLLLSTNQTESDSEVFNRRLQNLAVFSDTSRNFTSQGVPHEWIDQFYQGPITDYNALELTDDDSDGFNLLSEYLAGTNPLLSTDRLKPPKIELFNENELSFELDNPAAGRNYILYWSPDLVTPFTAIASGLNENTPLISLGRNEPGARDLKSFYQLRAYVEDE